MPTSTCPLPWIDSTQRYKYTYATDALGLGGVWIGTAPLEERMEAVEKIVGIPHDQRAFAVFPLGYPAEAKDQQNRFDESRIHWIDAK